MKSLADALPRKTAQQIHPDWRRNEVAYWAVLLRTREKLAAEFGLEAKAILADLRERRAALGGRLAPQKNEPNQRLKLTGAGILVFPLFNVFAGSSGCLA